MYIYLFLLINISNYVSYQLNDFIYNFVLIVIIKSIELENIGQVFTQLTCITYHLFVVSILVDAVSLIAL